MGVLRINGQERTFPEGLPGSVGDLLDTLGIEACTVVAEIDGRIVERKAFGSTPICSGQTIELIRFVGGG